MGLISVVYLFIHSKYLLMGYCVPGMLLGARDSVVNKQKLPLHYLPSQGETEVMVYQLTYEMNKQYKMR